MKWSEKKKNRAFETLFTYGGRHSQWLLRGTAATIGVVVFRLLMPWPLRGVIEIVFPEGSHKGAAMVQYLPEWGNPVILLGAIYVLFALCLGLAEMVQRVDIKRFSAQVAHDMRAAAVFGAGVMPLHKRTATGDILARIIGDSARIKASLSGIMVHGLQNGMLFIAASAVMAWVSIWFGLIFLVSGLIAIYIGAYTATPVAGTASKLRRKEGDYATAIQEGLETGAMDRQADDINWSSARKTVRITAMIARSSLYVHVLLAAAVALALWIGALGVSAGSLAPGDLFIFIAYAMTVHRRMVQVGRQIARSGKVLACADRLGVYTRYAPSSVDADGVEEEQEKNLEGPEPLVTGLRLERARLDTGHGREGKPRLRRTDLLIRPGSSVVVMGNVGSGKTSLLNILAGVEVPDRGRVYWDDEKILKKEGGLSQRVAYLSQTPVFPAARVWKHLGLAGPEALTPKDEKDLQRIGAWQVIESFKKGLEQKVASNSLSMNEARLLRLGGILLSDNSPVWVLDNPLSGLSGRKARHCLKAIIKRASNRILIVALPDQHHVQSFQRLLYMHKGKIQFDGTPSEYVEWKAGKAREKKEKKQA
ncbi:MAG: ABC transporter transmembrane domain-containing protein [Thermodesulfobacteriota bacterium]